MSSGSLQYLHFALPIFYTYTRKTLCSVNTVIIHHLKHLYPDSILPLTYCPLALHSVIYFPFKHFLVFYNLQMNMYHARYAISTHHPQIPFLWVDFINFLYFLYQTGAVYAIAESTTLYRTVCDTLGHLY